MADEQESFEGALVELRRRNSQWAAFVEHYLTNGFNATQAAISAGYAEKNAANQGYRLTINDEVKRAIDLGIEQLQMSADEVLVRLAAMARGEVSHFISQSEKGELELDLNTEGARKNIGLIREIEFTKIERPGEHGTSLTNKVKLKLHDAKDALKVIAQHKGLLKQEITLEDGPQRQQRDAEERRERLAALERLLKEPKT